MGTFGAAFFGSDTHGPVESAIHGPTVTYVDEACAGAVGSLILLMAASVTR
jgi:hypothetical protein